MEDKLKNNLLAFLEGQRALFSYEQEPLTQARFSKFLDNLIITIEESEE